MKFKCKLIVLVLLIAVAVSCVLCACDTDASLLKRNDERYSKQVTATATYGDRVSVVDLNELYTSFYRYYSYIYQYYAAGYISAEQFQQYMGNLDTTFADSNKSLARNAMYVLKNLDDLYMMGLTNSDATKVQAMQSASTAGKTYNFSDVKELERYYVDRSNEIKAVLNAVSSDYSFINAAIYYANQQMQTLFDGYVDEVREEYDALTKEEDTTPEGFTDIEIVSEPTKLVYEVDSNATISLVGMKVVAKYSEGDDVVVPNKYLSVTGFDASKAKAGQEITVTYGEYSKTFLVNIVEALVDRTKDADEEETDIEKIASLTENNTKILDKFVFEIDENDYIKDGLTDTEYAEATRELKIARTAMKRTVDNLAKNFRSYDYYLYIGYNNQVSNAYTQKVSATIRISYQELLNKYNELVTKALKDYETTAYDKSTIENSPFETIVHKNYDGEDFGYYYVSHVLFKFDEETQAKIDAFKNEKVANDDVVKEFAKSLIGEITVWESNPDFDATATCENEECTCPRCANYTGDVSLKLDTLKKWYGLDETVTDDPCVSFENGVRTVKCECKACPVNKYNAIVNAQSVVNQLQADLDACEDITAKNEVMRSYIYKYNMDPGMFTNMGKNVDYLMTPADIDSGMVKDYEEKCEELATAGIGSYGWVASSDYGIFFILCTGKVADVNEENVTAIENTDYVKLGLNYVTNPNEESHDGEKAVVYDGDTVIELEVGSIGYYIWHDLYEEAQSIELSKAQKAFFNAYAEDGITLNPKAYKDLIKSIKKGNA